MTDPILIYLEDHRAGAEFAVRLLESLREEHEGKALAALAEDLLAAIHEDREILDALIQQLGPSSTGWAKRTAAWLAEKSTFWKLRRYDKFQLGSFERLEILSLGILGKLALWRTLQARGVQDQRFTRLDLPGLVRRAQDQHARVEAERVQAARALPMPAQTA